jgi:endoglucanase
MNTQTKLLVGTLSVGLLALGGCLKPPPGSGAGPAPGSAASIGVPAAQDTPPPAAAGGAAAAPSAPSAPAVPGAPIGTTGFKECSVEGLIDDGEDGNNQNNNADNRGGYWYTFRDKKGTTIEPVAGEDGGTFAMSEGGHGSQFAARFHGKIGTGAPLFGGMGMNFVDPKEVYDSSKYAGISFWAKKGENSTGKVRLKVPDVNTDPQGGACTECFNDFGGDLNLTTDWKQYIFPWKSMKQMPGWGNPRKPHITPSKLYGIQFQVNVPSANYDIYIDDLKFICQ